MIKKSAFAVTIDITHAAAAANTTTTTIGMITIMGASITFMIDITANSGTTVNIS